MIFLILGGAGFIGSHIVDALLVRGHKVRVFDRPNVDTRNLTETLSRIEVVGGDFLNESDISSALEGIDVVVHLISTTLPKSSNENPAYDVESNVIGTLTLLRLAVQHGVKKIIFLSSAGTVYGASAICPISEVAETDPICSYGITKLAIEKYLHLFSYLHGLDYVVLRASNPFGARQNPNSGQGAVVAFLWRLLRDETILIWGDGKVTRDYFYISDLVSAVLLAIERKTVSKIFNVGSGIPCNLNELLVTMQSVTGRAPKVQYTPARKLDVPINFLDISRGRSELLWEPTISLEDGIARTWEWVRQRRED